jgi:hypothetical protein
MPRTGLDTLCLLIGWTLAVLASPAALAEDTLAQEPDVVVVGWTVDDAGDGNGDGGLHPGESAYLRIHLSNQGNETARWVDGQLSEEADHPDVEILDKFATWPDLPATGTPAESDAPHFRIRVAATRPCEWEIPLLLSISAEGYLVERRFTVTLLDPREVDLADGSARPFYYGIDSDDHLGYSAATGDVDGDGYDDLINAADAA